MLYSRTTIPFWDKGHVFHVMVHGVQVLVQVLAFIIIMVIITTKDGEDNTSERRAYVNMNGDVLFQDSQIVSGEEKRVGRKVTK